MAALIGNPMVFRDLPLEAALAKMTQLGFDALELWPPQIAGCRTEALRRQLVRTIESLGLHAVRLNAADRPYLQQLGREQDRQAVVDGLRADIDLAAQLGMSQLLTWEGRCPDGISREEKYGWLLDETVGIFRQATAYGRERGVSLSIEIHPFTVGIDVEWAMALCDRVAAGDLGVTYDCSHFGVGLPDGYIEAIERLGRRIRHLHFCDSDQTTSELHLVPGLGSLDLEGIVEALRRAGFDGSVMLDLWLYPLPEEGSRAGVPYVRQVMRRLGLSGEVAP